MEVAAVIVAGGAGSRIGKLLPSPKQYTKVGKKIVLDYSIEAFTNHDLVSAVQVVAREEDKAYQSHLNAHNNKKVLNFVQSGALRQDSVFAGLSAIEKYKPKYVLVHDAVRPLVTKQIIDKVIFALKNGQDAVVPALSMDDTIAVKNNFYIAGIPRRDTLCTLQTPQGFNFEKLIYCYRNCTAGQVYTDDVSLAFEFDLNVTIVTGDKRNLKITTYQDFKLCEFYMQNSSS